MIRVSTEQMAGFADMHRRDVARSLAERARSRDPDGLAERDIGALTDEIELEIARAHAQGMRSMRMLERWTDIALAVGFGFSEARPWALRALARADLSPLGKLERIESASVFAARAADR